MGKLANSPISQKETDPGKTCRLIYFRNIMEAFIGKVTD
jgi:hypothetical protein